MSEELEYDTLFNVLRVKNDNGDWMPAIKDITSHDITPLWVAGVVYIIMDRYLSCVDDAKQQDFKDEMITWLARMLKDDEATKYIEKMKFPKSLD